MEPEVIQFLKEILPLCNNLRFIYMYINQFLEPDYGMLELKRFKLNPKKLAITGFKKSSTGFIRHKDRLLLNQMYELTD